MPYSLFVFFVHVVFNVLKSKAESRTATEHNTSPQTAKIEIVTKS
jgi:hypothetical protein